MESAGITTRNGRRVGIVVGVGILKGVELATVNLRADDISGDVVGNRMRYRATCISIRRSAGHIAAMIGAAEIRIVVAECIGVMFESWVWG